MVVKKSAQCHRMHFLCQWDVAFAQPNLTLCRQQPRFWQRFKQKAQKGAVKSTPSLDLHSLTRTK
jgi:hypothetical protein